MDTPITLPEKTDSTQIVEDLRSQNEQLLQRVKDLEVEMQQTQDSFGAQRAKMKGILLQKEEELKRGNLEQQKLAEEVKRLNSELSELQQLVHETVEESTCSGSKYENEVKHLRQENERLESVIQELRSKVHHQTTAERDFPNLAPGVMLSAKTLAWKVASQLGAEIPTSSTSSQDNLEDSMRKVNKYAKEDAEVLRSLVVPLEEEIEALKKKLREADDQLRRYQGNTDNLVTMQDDLGTSILKDSISFQGASPIKTSSLVNLSGAASASTDSETCSLNTGLMNNSMSSPSNLAKDPMSTGSKQTSSPHSSGAEDFSRFGSDSYSEERPRVECDMCKTYKAQLLSTKETLSEVEKQLASCERTLQRNKEDMAKESKLRKDMEEKWNEKKEEHKAQLQDLNTRMQTAEDSLSDLRQSSSQTITEVWEQLSVLTRDRERVQVELHRLEAENEELVGRHTAHSQQLKNEMINLPDNVEDLQVLLLNFREELIAAKVAKEMLENERNTLQTEIQLLRDQMAMEQEGQKNIEDSLTAELDNLKKKVDAYEREYRHVPDLQRKYNEMQAANTALDKQKAELESKVMDLRSSIQALQHDLANAEAVQKDFVLLSQSLQVQLQKIRDSDSHVRWEHDEDVSECSACRSAFTKSNKKEHCRHCGHIFCSNCLTRTVPSGPNQRPSKVCDVCHTLLVKDTAPYFSTEPPQSQD